MAQHPKAHPKHPANALGKGSLLGSIETGKLADLYVVKGNPLDEITNTRNVQWVMKSGKVYNPQELLEQVKGNIGPKSEDDTEEWFKYPDLVKEAEKIKKKEGCNRLGIRKEKPSCFF